MVGSIEEGGIMGVVGDVGGSEARGVPYCA